MFKSFGIILIALGVIMLVWTSFTYTKKETIVDTGAIQIMANRQKTINWPPYAGCII